MVFKRTRTPTARFLLKVKGFSDPEGCWEWTGTRCVGVNQLPYGKFFFEGRMVLAHRFSYELFVGPIPPRATIDHLCRNPPCVNPAHLEPCSLQENIARGERPKGNPWANNGAHNRAKTRCPEGHELTPENTYLQDRGNGRVSRSCLTCRRVKAAQPRSDEQRRRDREAKQRERDRKSGVR